VDLAHQAMTATVRPMRTPLFGQLASRVAGFTATTDAARHYARNLLLDSSTRCPALDAPASSELAAAGRQLDASIAAITAALAEDGTTDGAGYVRSASLFARVADRLPDDAPLSRPQLALRDLQLLDGALAEAAGWAGVPVSQVEEPFASANTGLGAGGAAGVPPLAQHPRDGRGARQRLQRPPLNKPGDAEGDDRERLGVVDR
jgi:hypothetical protein